MQHTINLLAKAIETLKAERLKSEEVFDNPELCSDLIFAQNDMHNIDVQIASHQKAIKTITTAIKGPCRHQNLTQNFSDVFGYYKSCKDCGKDL